jgi:hypothetical protein
MLENPGRWPIHFGKYELLSRINIGGMAEIVKACDTSLPARPLVAVKRILPHLCDDVQYRTMFLDESRVLAQLDHPNIIHAFEIGEVEGTPYIAMDFVDGQDARTLFHKAHAAGQQIPIAIACHVIAYVCDGLQHAHEQTDANGESLGLVHRDVSLQNVLLSYAGDVKITDFGIAVSSQNEARTEVGIVKGKFGYMSPEQIRGAPLDRRSDVFGAGICLYEMLTGERLFVGDNDYKAIEKVRNVTIDPPSTFNRNIPSDLERIVLKALAKQPKDRHQTAHELRHELLAFMAATGERCTRDDLGAYLRNVFASEYEADGEDATTVGSDAALAAAREALPKRNDLAVSAGAESSSALDGTTGLAAFDHLDPISTVSFAVDPDVSSHVRLPAATAIPSLRTARQGTLPPPGLQVVTSVTPFPAPPPRSVPPVVPPIVPSPDSIPGTIKAADLLSDKSDNKALPEPRPLAMDWDEHEPTTISQGVQEPAAASFDDEAVTTKHDEPDGKTAPLPGLKAAFAADPFQGDAFTPVSEPGSPFTWREATSRPPAASWRAAANSFKRLQADPTIQLRIASVAVGLLVLLAAGLYWTRDRGVATIRLATEPRDAIVRVDGKPVLASASPFVIANLDAHEEHLISVDKPGYSGWSTSLKLRPDQVLDLPVIKLEPDAPPLPAAAEPPPPPAAMMPSPAIEGSPAAAPTEEEPPPEKSKSRAAARSGSERPPREPRQPREPRESREPRAAKSASPKHTSEPAPSAPAAASGGMGTLRVNSRPWSRVIVDGRLIGNTPQMSIPLRAGTHTLNLVNPEFGIDKKLTVEIKAGETITRAVTLQ